MSFNREEQVAELKALRREYREKQHQYQQIEDDGGLSLFEFLGPKVPDATEDDPTRFIIIHRGLELSVTVTLPAGYPSDTPPLIQVEGRRRANNEDVDNSASAAAVVIGKAHEEAIEDILAEQASYMPGMACVSTSLLALDDLDLTTLDLGQPGRCRTIFKVDVVNNSKQFTKSLKSAAAGGSGSPCAYFYRTIECQNNAKFSFAVDPRRAVYCVCDAVDRKEAVAFLKTVRTDGAMDMDMLGKPGKIQMTVMEEFEMEPKASAVCDGENHFRGTEYRTDKDLDELMDPLLAATAGIT